MAFISKMMLAFSSIPCTAALSHAQQPAYLNPAEPLRQRVEDLVQRMTLEEKIGRMNMPCSYMRVFGDSHEEGLAFARKFAQGTVQESLGPGGGFFTLANHALDGGTRQQVAFFNTLEEIATRKTRLKIPLLQTEEGTHGLICADATIFPQGLVIGSPWNLDRMERRYEITATGPVKHGHRILLRIDHQMPSQEVSYSGAGSWRAKAGQEQYRRANYASCLT